MKKHFPVFFIVFIFAVSCNNPADKQSETKVPGAGIVKEYFSTGQVKTEISVVGQLRQGPTKNYNMNGVLISEVNYVNNVREGIAKNYYASSGKLSSTLEYKNGIKQGDEIWYFESGQPYRISPFVNGKIEGIQRLYYENGNLKAEVPFKEGNPGTGLQEYKMDGTLIDDYPEIIIVKEDYLATASKILLRIRLSNNSTKVKFYKGKLDNGFLNKGLILMAIQDGIAQVDFNIPFGATIEQTVTINCNYKTPFGNPYITTKSISFIATNK